MKPLLLAFVIALGACCCPRPVPPTPPTCPGDPPPDPCALPPCGLDAAAQHAWALQCVPASTPGGCLTFSCLHDEVPNLHQVCR